MYVMLGQVAGKDPAFDNELRGRIVATLNIINADYSQFYEETPIG